MPVESNPRAPFKMSTEHAELVPPSGKPLIVHVVVNIEYWAYDQPAPRTIVAPPRTAAPISRTCRTSAGPNTATAAAYPGCSSFWTIAKFR